MFLSFFKFSLIFSRIFFIFYYLSFNFFRWYTLRGKPGKEKGKDKQRGELEVKVGFIVKAGSLTDLSKKEKHKSSLGQLSHMAQSVG